MAHTGFKSHPFSQRFFALPPFGIKLALLGIMACGQMTFTGCGETERSGYTGPLVEEVDDQPLAVEMPPTALQSEDVLNEALPNLPPGTVASIQRDSQGGVISQGYYCDNLPVGAWVSFHSDGTPASSGSYLYGAVRQGLWGYWNEFGRPQMVGHYDGRGREIGLWTFYHTNGEVSAQGNMLGGQRDGFWRSWNDAGKLTLAGTYIEGQRIGTWYGWDLDGQLHVVEESP
jgi:hypothetical protein